MELILVGHAAEHGRQLRPGSAESAGVCGGAEGRLHRAHQDLGRAAHLRAGKPASSSRATCAATNGRRKWTRWPRRSCCRATWIAWRPEPRSQACQLHATRNTQHADGPAEIQAHHRLRRHPVRRLAGAEDRHRRAGEGRGRAGEAVPQPPARAQFQPHRHRRARAGHGGALRSPARGVPDGPAQAGAGAQRLAAGRHPRPFRRPRAAAASMRASRRRASSIATSFGTTRR